jgi:RNA polymerase sigma-70 factor (ECF subfamily)
MNELLVSPAPSPDAGHPDEPALVGRAREGDGPAFETLVRRHHARLWRVVWRMVGPEQADEAMQDVIATARETLSSYQGEPVFATWLLRIAATRTQQPVTRRRAGAAKAPPSEAQVLGAEGTDRSLRPEALRALLEGCYERLPGELRTVLAIQLEGASYAEIAEIVAAPIWTVRTRVFRARQALANCMIERGAERG